MADYQFSRMPVLTPPVQTDYRRIQTSIPVPESPPMPSWSAMNRTPCMVRCHSSGIAPRAFRYTMRG